MNSYNVYEYFERKRVSLKRWENLLAQGWDRVGKSFFRQRFYYSDRFPNGIAECMPLRYNLQASPYLLSNEQQKILAQNQDLKVVFRPTQLDNEQYELFEQWEMSRFNSYNGLNTWVVSEIIPFPTYQLLVYNPEDKLIAASYFDIAHKTQYSSIAAYLPSQSHRKLGFFTLLKEVEFGIQHKRKYHHPGYAYFNYGAFDYKKTIPNTEYYDWETGSWKPLTEKRAKNKPLN